jgi:phosphatidylglycerophosphate synthase
VGPVVFWAVVMSLFVATPTTIVYWRNKGRLSRRASYLRSIFYGFRVVGWMVVAMSVLIFFPLWLTDIAGLTHWGYPWWTILLLLALVALGYGFQRLAKFLLQDEDLKNMIGRGPM